MNSWKDRLLTWVALAALTGCSHFTHDPRKAEDAKIHLQVSVERFAAHQYGAALTSCQKSLELNPSDAEAYNHLALIYMETKRLPQAMESFQKALELRPAYPEVHNNVGVLLMRQGKYSEAIPYFEKALADPTYRTPENPLTNIGFAHFKQGKLAQAKAFHQKALDIVPNFCLAKKNLGDVYVKERRFTQAEKNFRQAARNCPLYQEARYKLGLVLVKMGNRRGARAELSKLLRQHKEGPYVEKSQEAMKFLK